MNEEQIRQFFDELRAFDDIDVDEVHESDHSEQSDNENQIEYDPVPTGMPY
jgi:hypothetical protein